MDCQDLVLDLFTPPVGKNTNIMSENLDHILEHKRFAPTPESLSAMKNIRDMLEGIQKNIPGIRGIGFMGSRTKGQEKADSDLDIVVFYDWNIVFNTKKYINKEVIRDSFPVDIPLDVEHYGALHLVEIGKGSLDSEISDLVATANEIAEGENIPVEQIPTLPFRSPLSNLFMLAVGDQVYKARRYVLEQLQSKPYGEKYLQLLMKQLSKDEREGTRKRISPQYPNYPKTFEDAEKFFITEPYDLEELNAPLISPAKEEPRRLGETITAAINKFYLNLKSKKGRE